MNDGCPLCYTKNNTIVYDRLQLQGTLIVKCNHCAHIYTLQNNPPEIEKLYSTDAYAIVENRHGFFEKILGWEYKRIVQSITGLKPCKGQLLDFGCGKGQFANIAKTNGWKVKCVETAKKRALHAKNFYDLEVDTRLYSGGRIFDNDFDVLTLLHVLEHLQEPNIILKELIKYNLKKDALIVIEVPNIRSWQSGIAGNNWLHLDVPRHFHHFTPLSLEKFASDLNLKTLKSSSFSFHLGVLGMIDSFLKLFGYRKNIISELKTKKKLSLIIAISLLFSFAFVLETFAISVGRGGIIRKYFISCP